MNVYFFFKLKGIKLISALVKFFNQNEFLFYLISFYLLLLLFFLMKDIVHINK